MLRLFKSAALLGALIAACIALGMLSFGDGQEGAAGPFDWFAAFDRFATDLHDRLAFQVAITLLVVGWLLEKLLPARPQTTSNRGLNIPYGLMVVLFIGATGPLQVLLAERIFRWTGWNSLLDLRFETGHRIPLAAAAMLTTALVVDFFFYWFHRLQHANRLLWQAHLLHHTDVALNVTTTNRTHFFEHVLTPLFMATPITLLFSLPRSDIVVISVVPFVWSHVVHMNIRLGFGKFWWLVSSPQYHRIHHSIRPEHQNRNFAVWFPLWDILFGTAYAPRAGEYPATGVEGIEVSTFYGALVLPLVRWRDMARRAAWLGWAPARRPARASQDVGRADTRA
jgi:sterol desaturase/sphingolipid hydroxylase (fatty acid hydroxylase superfamily)